MKLILCLDERNGLSFNNRRQSRDRAVIDKIVCLAKEEPVWITSYSSELFRETHCNVRVSADIMHAAKPGEYLFIENQDPHELLAQVSSVYIFRWKRAYPYDLSIPQEILDARFVKVHTETFTGNSHPEIELEVYA